MYVGARPDRRIDAPGRDRDACPRERRGRPAGEELGADPDKRTVSERGNHPGVAVAPFGAQARRSVR